MYLLEQSDVVFAQRTAVPNSLLLAYMVTMGKLRSGKT
jgi:hypothetical protein